MLSWIANQGTFKDFRWFQDRPHHSCYKMTSFKSFYFICRNSFGAWKGLITMSSPIQYNMGLWLFKLRVLNDRSPGDGWGLPILVGQIASKDDGDHVIVLLPHCETLHGHRTRAWVKVAVLEPAHWLLGFQGGDLSEGSWNDQADLHGQATEAPGLTWRGWSYTGRGLILFFPPANF